MGKSAKNLKSKRPKVSRKQKNSTRYLKGTHTSEYVKVRVMS